MEKNPETLVAVPKRPTSEHHRSACLVQIYPTGVGMGTRYTLGDTPVFVGRDNDCQICLDDQSISRRHARIQPGIDGYYAVDLQSTNGTFVNDRPATMYKLQDGDYVRIGNWIFRYLAGGNVEAEYHEEIYRLTIIDGLTGTHNKRFLIEFLDRELARTTRHRRPLSLVLFDIDFFKKVNDEYGHLAGDYTLREIATMIKQAIRKEELLARYGGEEFAIVLPETDHDGAFLMAGRMRELIEQHLFAYEGKDYHVTISLGVVTTLGEENLAPTDLIRIADEKLYQAKNSGRNRVVG